MDYKPTKIFATTALAFTVGLLGACSSKDKMVSGNEIFTVGRSYTNNLGSKYKLVYVVAQNSNHIEPMHIQTEYELKSGDSIYFYSKSSVRIVPTELQLPAKQSLVDETEKKDISDVAVEQPASSATSSKDISGKVSETKPCESAEKLLESDSNYQQPATDTLETKKFFENIVDKIKTIFRSNKDYQTEEEQKETLKDE